MNGADNKLKELKKILKQLGQVAVAFSGGVDSTFLLFVANETLGKNVLAITARSGMFPARELNEAIAFSNTHDIRHEIVQIDELNIEGFAANPPERCYLCKRTLFSNFRAVALQHGFSHLAEGSNVDDDGDYRPGIQAIKELGILSPLKEAGLKKDEIRLLSKEMNLPTWEKPSFACLASRFPYGENISHDKLRAIEQAEQILFDLGFEQVRVRHHGNIARIEVLPNDMEKVIEPSIRQMINTAIKAIGFHYVTIDLQGYRTGSMNEVLKQK